MAEYMGDRVGQQLGPYRLTRLLGAGGFGEVYEADHRLLQQKRAIKLLLERHFHDPNQRERFLREACTLATLEHPNILPILEVGEEGSILYLVMPFYHRGTLNDLLKQRATPLPPTEVERSLAQMCAAVGYAHARQVAHLDLKPENMLLHEDGRLVLSDFGLAHLIKQGRLEAGSSASWGTPYYMAPEQIRGEPELRSDLYALGVILYQLLTTQRPFTGNTPEAVMMKHLQEVPPSLYAVSPEAPAALEPVMQKALGKQPEDRYATAEELLADFHAAVSSPSPRLVQPQAPGISLVAPTSQMNDLASIVQTTNPMPPERAAHTVEPANMTKATGTGCEIALNNGHTCGIPPIGRCDTCGRAFCSSHRAHTSYGGWVVNMCASCFAETPAEVERVKNEEISAAVNYIHYGTAQVALLTSGVQSVDIQLVAKQWKPGHFGLGGRYIENVINERGWILGEFCWRYRNEGAETEVVKDCLTAFLDISSNHWLKKGNGGLVRVQHGSEGYRILVDGESSDPSWSPETYYSSLNQITDWEEYIKIAQAVRRLTGESD